MRLLHPGRGEPRERHHGAHECRSTATCRRLQSLRSRCASARCLSSTTAIDTMVRNARRAIAFGRRKVSPRVCVADGKQHIRTFLVEALEEIGFVTCECMQASELSAVLTSICFAARAQQGERVRRIGVL